MGIKSPKYVFCACMSFWTPFFLLYILDALGYCLSILAIHAYL
uniref:Uncharacterized protein n=1 Tax=Rhizophora mucronata TaxID=61149 RepID=A0A2P2NJH3_RHIMU